MNRTITIKGIGKLSLKPDLTVVSLTLKTVRAGYDKAMDKAAKHLEQLRSAIAEIGFTKDDLKTTSFDVGTEYENERDKNGNYKQIFVGYQVTHGLKLEFDFDSQRPSKVLGAIAVCIAEPELNVQFTVKDKEAVDAALLDSACANAKAKAGSALYGESQRRSELWTSSRMTSTSATASPSCGKFDKIWLEYLKG